MNLIYSSMYFKLTKGKENRSPGQQRIGRTLSFNDLVKEHQTKISNGWGKEILPEIFKIKITNMRKYYITYNPLLMDIILTEFLTRGDKQHFWEKLNRQFRDELTLNNDLANSLELIKNTLKQMLKPAEESEEESKKEPNIISIITGLQNIKVAIKDPAVEKTIRKSNKYSY